MDIVEIALDYYTDFKNFERLAIEIMTLEGFGTIRPIGGIDDEGVDAEVVKYYANETQRIIFQFTIQKNLTSKITDTINKLKVKKIDFQQLIVVTKHQINNVQKHKRDARIKHGVNLEIFEKDTFIKHLSADNGILLRYFPDLKSQLTSKLFEKRSLFTPTSNTELEISLLKCSLLYTFNPKSEGTRKEIFVHTILGLLVSEQKPLTKATIIEDFKKFFGKEIFSNELDAVLARLKKDGLINISEDRIEPSKHAIEKIEGNLSKINSSTRALIEDIVDRVKEIFHDRLDTRNEQLITFNIKQSLSAYFRMYGVEYSEGSFLIGRGFGEDLIALAKKGISEKLGDAVVYALGEIVNAPTPDQVETLASWAKAFVGLQIMGLDPKLSEFQVTTLSHKTFILDTDFVLDCIVPDNKLSAIFLKLIDKLHKLRCKIIIPEETISEVIFHAQRAHGVYQYFKNIFCNVDSNVVEEKIQNVFVKGYYNAVLTGRIDSSETSFKNYLANYYDPESSFEFCKELLISVFSETMSIKGIATVMSSSLPFEQLEELIKIIFEETKDTVKGGYRTEEENREVATTDARLFLTTYYLNHDKNNSGRKILGGSHYLVTSSNRTYRCAKKMGLAANVISKPNTLINLLDQIGVFMSSASEIVNLFENPYLIDAVNGSWEDIKAITETGVSLIGKNIVRLRWDLDVEIKDFIASQNRMDENESITEAKKVQDYIAFIRIIKSKGYLLTPEIDLLETKVSDLEAEVKNTSQMQEKLQTEIEKFGKRRQQYFDRIRGKNEKKTKKQ